MNFHQALQPPDSIFGRTELWVSFTIFALIVLKWITVLWLEELNQRHLLARAGGSVKGPPARVQDEIDRQSVDYSLAKSRLHQVEATVEMLLLLLFLASGLLPAAFRLFELLLGPSLWGQAAFVVSIVALLAVTTLPLHWFSDFRIEQQFGFNTATRKTWWLDRVKGAVLGLALGYALLVLILKSVQWAGPRWWLLAWALAIGFQFLIFLLAPVLILPLFNHFEPLPEGTLRQRLLTLAARSGFRTSGIQVMDGSKRSRHSNAFFTGLGRFRRIVLFDTLIEQLNEPQLEAVLAHEIGHYKKYHLPKTFAALAISLLAAFFLLAQLAERPWFAEAFRLPSGNIACALLLFALLSGTLSFWLSPLVNYWSRQFEFQADAYAARTMQECHSLMAALRKLNEKNLTNPSPHPIYSRFYYSHPTLREREAALSKLKS